MADKQKRDDRTRYDNKVAKEDGSGGSPYDPSLPWLSGPWVMHLPPLLTGSSTATWRGREIGQRQVLEQPIPGCESQ